MYGYDDKKSERTVGVNWILLYVSFVIAIILSEDGVEQQWV